MALSFIPPLYHPCSLTAHPQHPPTSQSRRSRRWSRYSMLFHEEDSSSASSVATPVVPPTSSSSSSSTPYPPPEHTLPIPHSTSPLFPPIRARRSGTMSTSAPNFTLSPQRCNSNRRWTRLGLTIPTAISDDNDPVASPRLSEADTITEFTPIPIPLPRSGTRKRKRWSNSIGSATVTVIGAVRESMASMGNELAVPYPSSSPSSSGDVEGGGAHGVSWDAQPGYWGSEGTGREGMGKKRRRLRRLLRGFAASLAGMGAGGSLA